MLVLEFKHSWKLALQAQQFVLHLQLVLQSALHLLHNNSSHNKLGLSLLLLPQELLHHLHLPLLLPPQCPPALLFSPQMAEIGKT